MKTKLLIVSLLVAFNLTAQTVWINEIHYDNSGVDLNEGVEIAGPIGTDLSNYSLVFYNGSNSQSYGTLNLTLALMDDGTGFGFRHFDFPGMQNGAPDGVALFDGTSVLQFISYEGVITATDGVASGMTSEDIGVSESSTTQAGYSLQLQGDGTEYSDFTWSVTPIVNTRSALNTQQTIANLSTNEFEDQGNTIKLSHTVIEDYLNIYAQNNIKISIYSILGQHIQTTKGSNIIQVDMSGFSSGIYLLKITGLNINILKRVIKK